MGLLRRLHLIAHEWPDRGAPDRPGRVRDGGLHFSHRARAVLLVAGASAQKTLTGWKTWLAANNGTVMIVMFLIFGAKLVGEGLGGLVG